MKANQLYREIGYIDDNLIEDAAKSGVSKSNRNKFKWNKIILIAASICVISLIGIGLKIYSLAGLSGIRTSFTDYPYYNSTNELEASADAVVKGTVIEEKGKHIIDMNGHKYVYYLYDFKISECLKGDFSVNDIVTIKILANEQSAMDAGYFKKGTAYICYLKLYDNVPASLLNPSQGKRIIR